MCGIIGFSGKNNFSIEKIKSLFLYNAQRGLDGCGYYCNGKIEKTVDDIYDALPKWTLEESNLFIGHTRKSTYNSFKGVKHCHPFVFGNTIGVHNGTLTNHWPLCPDYGFKSTDFDIDSEFLFATLDKNVEVLKRIKGTASILFTKKDDPSTLYAFRKNDERPLYRGTTKEGMYISSLANSLQLIGCTNIEEFKEKYLYTIKDGKITGTRSLPDEVIKPVVHDKRNRHFHNPAFEIDDDEYRDRHPYTNYNTLYKRNTWVKVIKQDTSCKTHADRIKVGEFYQTSYEVSSSAMFLHLQYWKDLNNNTKDYPDNVLWNIQCIESYNIANAGVIAMAMTSGEKALCLGDIVFIRELRKMETISPECSYIRLISKNKVLNDPDSFSWDLKYFRIIKSDELLTIARQFGDKTPHHIINALVQCSLIKSKADLLKPPQIALPPADIQSTDKEYNLPSVNISNVYTELQSYDTKTKQNMMRDLRTLMMGGKTLSQAYDIVCKKAKHDNQLAEVVTDLSSNLDNVPEEEDAEVIDDDTPVDLSVNIPDDTQHQDEEIDDHLMSNIWKAVGDDYDNLIAMKDNLEKVQDKIQEIEYDATQEEGQMSYYQSPMCESLTEVSLYLEEIYNKVESMLATIKEEYSFQKKL